MSLSNRIAANLPYLRRYARALTGSQESGDTFVRATLQASLDDPSVKNMLEGGRAGLYRAFTIVWTQTNKDTGAPGPDTGTHGSAHEAAARGRLSAITPLNRQALLLTTLEEFSTDQAAEILGLPSDKIGDLVQDAINEIDHESTTDVLIIEDEPLISMQLEELVGGLGHTICGTAATRTQAQHVAASASPGLVLADIQLADGSSGLDAVDDILAIGSVPVIFITAYPERLLTGDRPEPTYLITKPFQEKTVRAAISQALFFRSSSPIR